MHARTARQVECGAEHVRRVHEGVAVHDPEARKLRVLQAGDHAKHTLLFAEAQVRLESDEIVGAARAVFRTQLHGRPGAPARRWVGQTHGLQGAETQGIGSRARHLLDGLAGGKQLAALEIAHDRSLGGEKLGDETLIGVAGERRVQVVGWRALVVAGLLEDARAVDGIGLDDGGGGIVEGKAFGAQLGRKRLGQRVTGQRACGHDGRRGGQARKLAVLYFYERVFLQQSRDRVREQRPVHGKRPARRHGAFPRRVQKKRVHDGQLAFQGAGRRVGIVAFKRVRAHELGRITRFVDRRLAPRAHLDQAHGHAARGKLQSRLAARKTGAHHSDCRKLLHVLILAHAGPATRQRGKRGTQRLAAEHVPLENLRAPNS